MKVKRLLRPMMALLSVFVPSHLSRAEIVYEVPIEYHKLDNGLKVVLSPDYSAPIVTVAVYYGIGSRAEPAGRTGFAHLFEHMMFQGSTNLPKGEFSRLIEGNGGYYQGITRFDFTGYYEIMPAHTLETVLWAEADRMQGLKVTQVELANQQNVVANEVKMYVCNKPYGEFHWLEIPQHAYENWPNAHSFYGDLDDIAAATLEDVRRFYDTYYAPNNAALAVVGDFNSAKALVWVKKYFGHIPAAEVPTLPDMSEPRQTKEKRVTRTDKLANRPALAFAYHVPKRFTPEYFAFGFLDQLLLQGEDSRLHQAVVKKKGMTGSLKGGINVVLGNMFTCNDPTLWTGYLFHDSTVSADAILESVDEEIERLRTTPIKQAELERMRIKIRSDFYDKIGRFFGLGRAEVLACFALFDANPNRVNSIEERFRQVTPELILETAREYLRPANRTVLMIEPEPMAQAGGASKCTN